MTHTVRLPPFASAMAAAFFSLVTLAPCASNEAVAQGIQAPRQAYYNAYGAGYNNGYNNAYQSAYGNYGYGGPANYGYTGYGNGPYGYRASAMFPNSGGYSYGHGTTYNSYYRGSRYDGGTYRAIYTPNNVRYYSPYGNGGY